MLCQICRWIGLLGLLVAVGTWPSAAAADTLRFNRDIRPILSGKCFSCHGPDANHREADLRFASAEMPDGREPDPRLRQLRVESPEALSAVQRRADDARPAPQSRVAKHPSGAKKKIFTPTARPWTRPSRA